MSKKVVIVPVALFLLAAVAVIAWFKLRPPSQVELKATPFSTHENMLAVNITARRLSSPSIDDITLLEKGRLSTSVPGDSRIKLLNSDREELFTLEFEATYAVTSDPTQLRDEVLLTFVLPYSPEVAIVRVETPQGSAEEPIELSQ